MRVFGTFIFRKILLFYYFYGSRIQFEKIIFLAQISQKKRTNYMKVGSIIYKITHCMVSY